MTVTFAIFVAMVTMLAVLFHICIDMLIDANSETSVYVWDGSMEVVSSQGNVAAATDVAFDIEGLPGDGPLRFAIAECDGDIPRVVAVANSFLPSDYVMLDITGTDLLYLPAPSVVEISGKWVVFVDADESHVTVIDPSVGYVDYGFREFQTAYAGDGLVAMHLTDRGYAPETDI